MDVKDMSVQDLFEALSKMGNREYVSVDVDQCEVFLDGYFGVEELELIVAYLKVHGRR